MSVSLYRWTPECDMSICPGEHGEVIYMVNNMLHQMEREILKRMDGGADDAAD